MAKKKSNCGALSKFKRGSQNRAAEMVCSHENGDVKHHQPLQQKVNERCASSWGKPVKPVSPLTFEV